jgi:maltose O-acetyltransferase
MGKGVVIDVGVRIHSPRYVSIGDNTWIDNYVVIFAGPTKSGERLVCRKPNPAFLFTEGEVVIGKNCHISNFVVLQGHGGLSVGDCSTVASGSLLYSMSHHHRDPTNPEDLTRYKFSSMAAPHEQSLIISPVVMEADTALGLGSVMLPGATIHEGSWVGAKSLVLKSVPPHSIASGSPAKVTSVRPG